MNLLHQAFHVSLKKQDKVKSIKYLRNDLLGGVSL